MANDLGTGDEPEHAAGSLLVRREAATLRQRATDILRQAIIEERFPPGMHLVERELCALLGVSRTSVREALRHLESERLIRMIPHRGPVVASLTFEEARSIYQVRAALEGLAGALFAAQATDAQIDRLRRIVAEMKAACVELDPHAVLEIKSRFYDVIFEGARNDVCAQMIDSLNARVWILRRMSLASPGRPAVMMEEVHRIVEAAAARDANAMRAACIAHVESAASVVLPRLREAARENEAARA